MTDMQYHQIMAAIYTVGVLAVDRLWAMVFMAVCMLLHTAIVVMLMMQ